MNISRVFIERPIATVLLMTALLLAGLLGYRLIPVSALPEVDFPTIQVYTRYPGASPEVISATVTAPLERQLGQMSGLKTLHSSSSDGVSTITLQFELALSLDVAEQEVQAAINASANYLPSTLPYPPVYSKVNPGDAPILTLALSSNVLPLTRVEDLAETRLAQKIAQISGVGLVTLSGGQRPAIRVSAHTDVLNGLGMSIDDLRTVLSSANVDLPKGSLNGDYQSYAIGANDQLGNVDDYRNLPIAYKNGAPVRLSQIADVHEGAENRRQAAWDGDAPAIIMNIQRQPGFNVIKAVDAIEALLPQLRAGLPATVDIAVLADRTQTIRASVRDVQWELTTAVVLVVMVIFLFLRRLPATLIPAITLPLSLLGTLACIYALGFSLNNLTLMSLTIATGFVVDDAIVMIENITRYRESGETPMNAALKGARQVGFTIVSLSIALTAVMIPLLLMGDVVGRLFREFALTLVAAIVISAAVSLTLTPMLCAHLFGADQATRRMDWLDGLNGAYLRALERVLNHRLLTLSTVAAATVLTFLVLYWMPKGFFPRQDTGLIQGISRAAPTVSFDRMAALQRWLVVTLNRDPAVKSLSSFIGIDQTNPVMNQGVLLLTLKDKGRRGDMDSVLRRLSAAAAGSAGMRLYLRPVQDLTFDDAPSATDYRVGLTAVDAGTLGHWTRMLLAALKKDPVFADPHSDALQQGNQIQITFNRDTLARLGVTPQQIDDVLYDAFGQRQISTVYDQSNQYHVVLDAQRRPDDVGHLLSTLYVAGASGALAPLAPMATLRVRPAPLMIERQGQFPYADIAFNLAPGVDLGQALAHLRRAQRDISLPAAVQVSLEGAAATFQDSLAGEAYLVAAAILAVYLLLGMLYESFAHPLTLLSTLPSAAFGAVLALWLTGTQFDIMAIIGIVLLIGIVMKNAIMMIDFALEAERREGLSPVNAIRRAAELRFRPILMTTAASLFSAIPLALGRGEGSELRHPLGIAIIGGLFVSQVLTLFSTPVIYLALSRLSTPIGRRFTGGHGR
ncbi:efflux RND transporter permease subunit [Martelella alba]|uniref:Multidrug transporter subunit MdtC n=1 Tax=Martelella alba TaxID=2590451 RepID=A0ABY2SMG9_9HYPH|nr:efflux RND transporter permease subunit [Martelella alba]TKI06107.1 multidrug transporter subunit MdtC [Martelella alba]